VGEHAGYLDRMTSRLTALEHELEIWCECGADERQSRVLQARLNVLKERLQMLRRAGGDVTAEMTQSFAQEFERFRSEFARARAAGDDPVRVA
jgi:hypothetical protein